MAQDEQTSVTDRNFVFLIVSQDKQSNYIHSQMESESKKYGGYHIYSIYSNMKDATDDLHDIYVNGYLGVEENTEYHIIKKEVK